MKFPNEVMIIYLIVINLFTGLVFFYDKNAAEHNRRRISEKTLHLLELLGGVFAIAVLMYTIRHKNRKFSYWGWTWLMLVGWILIIYFLKQYM